MKIRRLKNKKIIADSKKKSFNKNQDTQLQYSRYIPSKIKEYIKNKRLLKNTVPLDTSF